MPTISPNSSSADRPPSASADIRWRYASANVRSSGALAPVRSTMRAYSSPTTGLCVVLTLEGYSTGRRLWRPGRGGSVRDGCSRGHDVDHGQARPVLRLLDETEAEP